MIEFGNHFLVCLEVLPVAIPPRTPHSHERHASLDQSPCNQRLFRELRWAVAVANLLRFLGHVEQLLGCHDAANTFVSFVLAVHDVGAATGRELLAKHVTEIRAFFVVEVADVGEPLDELGVVCYW